MSQYVIYVKIIINCFFRKKTEIACINTLFMRIWKDHSAVHFKYSEVDVIEMLEFLIDNIYVEFSG